MYQGLHKAGFRLSSDARDQLVKRLDIDGDGVIEYHEFVRFAQTQSVPTEVGLGVALPVFPLQSMLYPALVFVRFRLFKCCTILFSFRSSRIG